jgi:hypothetical protein
MCRQNSTAGVQPQQFGVLIEQQYIEFVGESQGGEIER